MAKEGSCRATKRTEERRWDLEEQRREEKRQRMRLQKKNLRKRRRIEESKQTEKRDEEEAKRTEECQNQTQRGKELTSYLILFLHLLIVITRCLSTMDADACRGSRKISQERCSLMEKVHSRVVPHSSTVCSSVFHLLTAQAHNKDPRAPTLRKKRENVHPSVALKIDRHRQNYVVRHAGLFFLLFYLRSTVGKKKLPQTADGSTAKTDGQPPEKKS